MLTGVPLTIERAALSRLDKRAPALYLQLSDLIREQIDAGELRPGEPLPSEAELGAASGLSRSAIRDALNTLVVEGRIVKQGGAPTRVATPPPVRHMTTSRYADELALLRDLGDAEPHPHRSAFTADHGAAWDDYRVQADYTEDAATEADAARLNLWAGAPVLRRQLVKFVAGEPVQIQESVIPLKLVAGTPVADPARQPWPGGTIAELFSVGLVVCRVREEARARTPSTAERRTLEMEAAGPVWEVERTFWARGDGPAFPAETSTVVVPAARMVLSYETELS